MIGLAVLEGPGRGRSPMTMGPTSKGARRGRKPGAYHYAYITYVRAYRGGTRGEGYAIGKQRLTSADNKKPPLPSPLPNDGRRHRTFARGDGGTPSPPSAGQRGRDAVCTLYLGKGGEGAILRSHLRLRGRASRQQEPPPPKMTRVTCGMEHEPRSTAPTAQSCQTHSFPYPRGM